MCEYELRFAAPPAFPDCVSTLSCGQQSVVPSFEKAVNERESLFETEKYYRHDPRTAIICICVTFVKLPPSLHSEPN